MLEWECNKTPCTLSNRITLGYTGKPVWRHLRPSLQAGAALRWGACSFQVGAHPLSGLECLRVQNPTHQSRASM